MSSSSTHPTIDRRDLDFHLFEVLQVEALTRRAAYADHDRSTFAAVLDIAQQLAADKYQTHYRESDLQEPRLEDGKVWVLPQVKEALRAFAEAGFITADRSYDEGGQQLPFAVYQACLACFQAANIGTSSYNFLTISGARVISAFGTAEQRRRYMQPMLQGRFLGTMCLSEPHAGSGLADIRTRAVVQADGRYRLKGSKMWISAGEHELADNIVHLVLARIDGAPPGTRGISLFIVPRRRVNDDGSIGDNNDVSLVGLNHKMGYRGTVNTLLNFGEHDRCVGELLGEPNRGLAAMFHMMNEARISVGVGATMLGVAGYLYSLMYARERAQGRLPDAKDPTSLPVKIIEHADVRRMLIAQKSYAEGALALGLYAATLVDDLRTAPTRDERDRAAVLLEILTPLVKSWPSEFCLEANKLAMQVLGGYGYTRDYPVEQFYRDNRLNLIHEGTHGIQAMDLVHRKIRMNEGEAFELLVATIRRDIDDGLRMAATSGFAQRLGQAVDDVSAATAAMQATAPNARVHTANATLYLDMLGHVAIAWMWLRQATVAARRLEAGGVADHNFYRGKLTACRYFYTYELSRLAHWLPLLRDAEPLFAELDPDCL
jgi:alkylation response protein AidB-like acyl-CoA dehydrogenase